MWPSCEPLCVFSTRPTQPLKQNLCWRHWVVLHAAWRCGWRPEGRWIEDYQESRTLRALRWKTILRSPVAMLVAVSTLGRRCTQGGRCVRIQKLPAKPNPEVTITLSPSGGGGTACLRPATYPHVLQLHGPMFGGCWQHIRDPNSTFLTDHQRLQKRRTESHCPPQRNVGCGDWWSQHGCHFSSGQ